MVDRPRAGVPDEDAALGGRDDLIDPDVLRAWQERDVGHALELHAAPGVRERTAVRARDTGQLLNPSGQLACGLIVVEYAFVDDQPLIRLHTFVIPGDAG